MVAKTRRLDYGKLKTDAAARSRLKSRSGRDIGSIAPILDLTVRRSCDRSLQAFCEQMFPARFTLAWSRDHLKVIGLMEKTVQEGGRVAVAMPRGSGKTSIAEVAALWATMTARHRFVMLIGATAPDASTMLENIQSELGTNEQLAATYPGVCGPIWALEGESRRANGQLHHGRRTAIHWGQDEIRFATIPGEPASGAVIQTAGIEGRIRGRRVVLPTGESIRPTLAILDDLQTDESAWSETQCETRRRIVEGSVSGLSGPGREVAMVMPCTVIRRHDLADKMLDRTQSPERRGIRTKMIDQLPASDELWQQYADLRIRSLVEREDITLATEFYRKHQAKMDAGAAVSWPERYNRASEISALQHAMNLKLNDEVAFSAEYQNEPIDTDAGQEVQLSPAGIAARINKIARRAIPTEAEHLTAFVDVQGKMLYYAVIAWSERADGWVVDYGSFPDQGRRYFTLRDSKKTLARYKPGAGQEAQIYAGLIQLTDDLCGREWEREDGTPIRVSLCLVDANWGTSTEVVYKACRASDHAAQLMPSHGRYYGASTKPIIERTKKRGDRMGLNWFIPAAKPGRVRHVVWDTNWWKTFAAARLATPIGDPGCMTLYGSNPDDHRMLAEHLTSEIRIQTEGRGRRVDEWKLKRAGLDNHLLDCVVGAGVAGAIRGATLGDQLTPGTPRRKRIKHAERSAR